MRSESPANHDNSIRDTLNDGHTTWTTIMEFLETEGDLAETVTAETCGCASPRRYQQFFAAPSTSDVTSVTCLLAPPNVCYLGLAKIRRCCNTGAASEELSDVVRPASYCFGHPGSRTKSLSSLGSCTVLYLGI